MKYYRLKITPLSPLQTPLISGTLWGHLAWAVRYLEGEDFLTEWLKRQEESPWLISSSMPEGMLPRPLLTPMPRKRGKPSLEELQDAKKIKKIAYISEDIFLSLRDGMNEVTLSEALKSAQRKEDNRSKLIKIAKNRIDRLSARTPDSGGLYFVDAEFYAMKIQVFIGIDEAELELLRRALDYVATFGFGADASTGYGAFSYELSEENRLFVKKGGRCMSLSHGVITSDMKRPFYKIHTHFGKLGGHLIHSYSPFKYPILMAKPGATFDMNPSIPFYGKILDGVHHDPELAIIRHHAAHLPITFKEASE